MGVLVYGRGEQAVFNTAIETETCAACGIVFGLPVHFINKRREDGQSFYCPNGHSLVYNNGKSKADKLARELRRERESTARLTAQLDQQRAATRAQKGLATRYKRQRDRDRRMIANGVCQCCKRSFRALARHMRAKHPEYSLDDE